MEFNVTFELNDDFGVGFTSDALFAADFGVIAQVNDIPWNYGLITYNGSTITVS